MGRAERGSSSVVEVINWEEKYVSYVEGDLRRDIQELKDGQKALDAKIENGLKSLDTKIVSEVNRLRSEDIQEIKSGQAKLDAKIEKLGDKIEKTEESLRKEINKFYWPVILLLAAGVIGGLVRAFIR
jgi:predicted phage-related endonuclease